ncbi:MAG: S8 family serine peptidase [bacterium]|jgi:minor extracellular serine protease Vpr
MKLFNRVHGWIIGVLLLQLPFGYAEPTWEDSDLCFVVLESQPVLMYQQELSGGRAMRSLAFQDHQDRAAAYAHTLQAEQDDILKQVRLLDRNVEVTRRFTHLVNALTIRTDQYHWTEIATIPGVSYVTPVGRVKPLLTESRFNWDVPQAWDLLGGPANAGEGVFIAIVDTGIDVTHPAFDDRGYEYPSGFPKGDLQFTNKKVIAAYSFPPSSGPQGDTTPRDRVGHGTNVASIAAANDNTPSPLGMISGVAPRAWLGNYKVFTNDDADFGQIISGIEQAVLDGADVINLSLGTSQFSDPQHDLQVKAVRNAIDLGVVVVVAAGNDGRPITIGNPAQVEEAITVGSITNSHESTGSSNELVITARTGSEVILANVIPQLAVHSIPFDYPIVGTFDLVDADLLDGGGYGGENDGLVCEPLSVVLPPNTWVLIKRGTCNFENKIQYVQQAGGTGVLFYNQQGEELIVPNSMETYLPSMMISYEEGLQIREALREGKPVQITVEGVPIQDRDRVANVLASSSSRGPSVHYSLKPDVVAIGQGNYAATQNDVQNHISFSPGGFRWLSGTSMAAPRVSGLAALLIQQHPDWAPAWIKSIIGLGAISEVWMDTGKTRRAGVLERGSGRVNALNSMRVDTIAMPHLLGFGRQFVYGEHNFVQTLTIVNPSDTQTCTYRLEGAAQQQDPGLIVSQTEFTLAPRERKLIQVTLRVSANLFTGDYEQVLYLVNTTTNQTYTIPVWIRVFKVNRPNADILLIDDDGGERFDQLYKEQLSALGYSYIPWDVNLYGQYPSRNYMENFETIIWFLGESSLNSIRNKEDDLQFYLAFNERQLFEDHLMQYLELGGTLLLSGMDYIDQREGSAFIDDLLGVDLNIRDAGATSIFPAASSPITTGIISAPLNFPAGFNNFVDKLSILSSRAKPAFYGNQEGSSTVDRSKVIGVTAESCSYRAVFLAFPLEVLPAESARIILRNSITWLQDAAYHLPMVSSISPEVIQSSASSNLVPITIRGEGFSLREGYHASLNDVPVQNLTRWDCNTLTGQLPANLRPGNYTLKLVTGSGLNFTIPDILQVTGNPVRVQDWALH